MAISQERVRVVVGIEVSRSKTGGFVDAGATAVRDIMDGEVVYARYKYQDMVPSLSIGGAPASIGMVYYGDPVQLGFLPEK